MIRLILLSHRIWSGNLPRFDAEDFIRKELNLFTIVAWNDNQRTVCFISKQDFLRRIHVFYPTILALNKIVASQNISSYFFSANTLSFVRLSAYGFNSVFCSCCLLDNLFYWSDDNTANHAAAIVPTAPIKHAIAETHAQLVSNFGA